MKLETITPCFVEFIPDQLETGVLFISTIHSTAIHLCCCGCGKEVVTPLGPGNWRLHRTDSTVSLSPSIGNWNFACKSHYFIRRNRVEWAALLSEKQIKMVQNRDFADIEAIVASNSEKRRESRDFITPTTTNQKNKKGGLVQLVESIIRYFR